MSTQNVLTPGPHLYDYGVTCMSVLYFHASTMVFKVILINTQHCMNGEADNYSRMYVHMHLAFKELRALCQDT